MDLKDLLQACKKNNRQAQNELYHRYKDVLYLVSLKYCRNITDAEDNLHDAFLSIFKSLNSFKNTGSFEGWMKRITINQAINKYKKNKTNITFEIIDDVLEDVIVEIDQLNIPFDQILLLIQNLPDKYRLVFNLYELDEYSHREISKMLNISEGTSKSNLHRAKLILKKRILEQTLNPKTVK